jgi:hypothetical protein
MIHRMALIIPSRSHRVSSAFAVAQAVQWLPFFKAPAVVSVGGIKRKSALPKAVPRYGLGIGQP